MYSEIKDNSNILINRLTDAEKILLQDMYNKSKNSNITFQELNGETGEFSGIMINMTPIEPKTFDLTEELPTQINMNPNSIANIVVPTEVNDVTVLTKIDNYTAFDVVTSDKVIVIHSKALGNTKLQYEVMKEGYESIYGEIEITSVLRESLEATIEVLDSESKEPIEDASITVKDENDTEILPVEDKVQTYELKLGRYTLTVEKENYTTNTQELVITEDDLMNAIKTIKIELVKTNQHPVPSDPENPSTETPDEVESTKPQKPGNGYTEGGVGDGETNG